MDKSIIFRKIFNSLIHFCYSIKKKANKVFSPYKALFDYCYLKYWGVETQLGYVQLFGLPLIKRCENSRIILDKGVALVSDSRINPAGINHPVILATLAEGAVIHLKSNCAVSGVSICAVKRVVLGENTQVGVNTNIYDTDFHVVDSLERSRQKSISQASSKPVEIGNNTWIGANVMILKGVKIGTESIVGSGSIVTCDIPNRSIFAGNPARSIKS